jgi:RNA polymerase sigma-70 factor (ECF subfamily)
MVTEAEPTAEQAAAAIVLAIAAGGAGARAAEETLCRRYAPRIQLYGVRHLRDPESIRDLVQIVLLGVLQAARAGRVREPQHLERFILGTCRNAAIRLRQKGSRDEPTELEKLEEMLVTVDEEPLEKVDPKGLARCMDELEARARKVVVLAFREERSADEIARVLKTTSGNVRVIRHRAVAALRTCLDRKM